MGAEEIKPNGISGVIANEHDITHFNNRGTLPRHVMLKCIANGGLDAHLLEQSSNKGDIPVCHHVLLVHCVHLQNHAFWEWSAKWVVSFFFFKSLVAFLIVQYFSI